MPSKRRLQLIAAGTTLAEPVPVSSAPPEAIDKLQAAKRYLEVRAAAHPKSTFKYSPNEPTVLTPTVLKRLRKKAR